MNFDTAEKSYIDKVLDLVEQTSFDVELDIVKQTSFEKSCWAPLPQGTYSFSDFIKVVDEYILKIHNMFNDSKDNKNSEQSLCLSSECAIHSKSVSSSNSSKQHSRVITNPRSFSRTLKSDDDADYADIPEVVIYYKNGETVCCINYHEDATAYYKNIVESCSMDELPDTSCTAPEPPLMESVTEIAQNFNLVEPIIMLDDPFSDSFYETEFSRSVSESELLEATMGTANVTSSTASLMSSTSVDPFSDPNSNCWPELWATSNNETNTTPAFPSHVILYESSPASENKEDVHTQSSSLGASTTSMNELEHCPCFSNETLAATNEAHLSDLSNQVSIQLTDSNKSASTLKCAADIYEEDNCVEGVINHDDPFSTPYHRIAISHSLPELVLPSTKTPAFLSVQSCEKLSALEKEVEILRAKTKYLPVYKHTSFFAKKPVTPASHVKPNMGRFSNCDKSASTLKHASEKLKIHDKFECANSCEDVYDSLTELVLTSATSSAHLSLQSSETIVKKVEFSRATGNNCPDQPRHNKMRAIIRKIPSFLMKLFQQTILED